MLSDYRYNTSVVTELTDEGHPFNHILTDQSGTQVEVADTVLSVFAQIVDLADRCDGGVAYDLLPKLQVLRENYEARL